MTRMLNIYILNSGIGESIILEFPSGGWGLIDCYSRSLNNTNENPTLRLLKEKDVQRLEFLAITHPHHDHFRGMSQVLAEFEDKIERLFFFDAVDTYKLLAVMKKETRLTQDLDRASSLVELFEVLKFARAFKKKKRSLRAHKLLYAESNLSMYAIGPTQDIIDKYEHRLHKAFDNDLKLVHLRNENDKNLLSGVLYLQYGKTRILLGGDAEKDSWDSILEDCKDLGVNIRFDFIKVSHHGSYYAYNENLWSKEGDERVSCAVVTPYCRYNLPDPTLIGKLKHRGYKIHTTWPLNYHASDVYSMDLDNTAYLDEVIARLEDDSSEWIGEDTLQEQKGFCFASCDENGNITIRDSIEC